MNDEQPRAPRRPRPSPELERISREVDQLRQELDELRRGLAERIVTRHLLVENDSADDAAVEISADRLVVADRERSTVLGPGRLSVIDASGALVSIDADDDGGHLFLAADDDWNTVVTAEAITYGGYGSHPERAAARVELVGPEGAYLSVNGLRVGVQR